MNENNAYILLWMLMAVSLGLMVGWALGDEVRRRKNAEAKVHDLSKRLEQVSFKTPLPEAQLRKMAFVLNDAHKQITAVSKALRKSAS
jgi:hypothetical protein